MTARPYTLEFEDRPGYLVARVSGPTDSAAIKLAYFAEVAAEARARGLRKVLVVEALDTTVAFGEVSGIASQLPPVLKGLIIAFVDLQPEHHEVNRLGEAVAVDGGAVGRVFRTLAEAEKWIAAVP